MGRQIDYTKPLSDEDREYLNMRGEHARVEQMDAQFPADAEEPEEPEQLEDLDPEDDDPEDDGDPEPPEDYADWKKADLVAEAKERGLDHNGTAEELRARLMEHDAEQADGD